MKNTDNSTPCNCDAIEIVNKHTYLGLIIDDRLNWKEHVNRVCGILRGILAKFTLIKHKIPYSLMLYKSLAESVIIHGLSSYGKTYKTYLDRIYSLYLRILKQIVQNNLKINFKDDYRKLFAFCKIIPIHDKVDITN